MLTNNLNAENKVSETTEATAELNVTKRPASELIREYKSQHPNATVREIAESLKLSRDYVYSRMYLDRKKEAPRKRGRPKKLASSVTSKPATGSIVFVQPARTDEAVRNHPLYPLLVKAIEQAMYGKGERHGGAMTPFMEQPWAHYAKLHGRGFLTGQASKKLEEAASTRTGETFEAEVLGAIVYAGMAILFDKKPST
jgi:hypothetical protein